jgi:hypothetical protein
VLDNHHSRQYEHGGRRHAARPRAVLTAPALTQDVGHGLTANSILICAYDHTPACRYHSGGDYPPKSQNPSAQHQPASTPLPRRAARQSFTLNQPWRLLVRPTAISPPAAINA